MFRITIKPLAWVKAVYAVALLAVFFLVSLATAQAATVTLNWTASTSTTVTGYNVYYGTASGSYGPAQNAGNTTAYTTPDLPNGTYYFVVKARDSAGNESGPSNEVSSTTYTFTTQPSGLNLSYNGVSRVTPFTVRAAVGSSQQISALATQSSYNFSSWSDGGAATHAITISGSPQTITANYTATAPAPVASCAVSTSMNNPTTATTITYTGRSSGGSVATWSWNFNSSFSSGGTGSTVVGNYTNPGTYTATVTATGSGGSSTATCPSVTVTAAAPAASFSATPTSGTAPLAVNFTDSSQGSITSQTWNFGDGTSSTAQNPAHTYANSGTYTVTLTATGPGGSNTATRTNYVTVSAASANNGLVAAYNFEEASGATVVDASGKGNHGALACNTAVNASCTAAARTTSGKFGKAISFDGTDDWVTVNHSASLSLTTGMTLEAWVYPTAINGWRTVLAKEESETSGIYMLFANSDWTNQATAIVDTGAVEQAVAGGTQLALNKWTHLAATYDGQYERLYINGTQVAMQPQTGSMINDTGKLYIGGTKAWGWYFKGRIDEIRVYNRALSGAEIGTDMNTAVATSSPVKRLLGEQEIGTVSEILPQGTAAAFQTTASVNGMITSLPVYVDTGSASTKLVAGLYKDNNGHPGARITTGTLSSPVVGWNKVLVPAIAITAGKYWVAILSPKGNGDLKFRDRVGSIAQPSETSKSTSLTSLPNPWVTGTVSSNGPLSGYGAGY